LKKEKILRQLRQVKFKIGVAMVITIIGISLVSVGGNNNVSYTNSENHYIQLLGSAPTPVTVAKTLYGTTKASISVRTGAHVNYSIFGTMPKGTKIVVTGVAGSFYRVTYNKRTGYISSSAVTLTAKPIVAAPTPVTVAKTLYGTTKATSSVRTGAHINYSVYTTMPKGTKIVITGVAGSFYRVTYAKRTGYVSSSAVTLTAKPVPAPVLVYKNQVGMVTANGIGIRSGPGSTYSPQGSFAINTELSIVATAGSWYKVSYSGKSGFVSNQYVRIVSAAEQARILAAAKAKVAADAKAKADAAAKVKADAIKAAAAKAAADKVIADAKAKADKVAADAKAYEDAVNSTTVAPPTVSGLNTNLRNLVMQNSPNTGSYNYLKGVECDKFASIAKAVALGQSVDDAKAELLALRWRDNFVGVGDYRVQDIQIKVTNYTTNSAYVIGVNLSRSYCYGDTEIYYDTATKTNKVVDINIGFSYTE